MSAFVIAERELFDSCRILFGADMNITRGFLEYLQPAGIKTAYRKKAIETHPDMQQNKSDVVKRKSADLFHVVQQAYETLTSYLDARERGASFQFKARSHKTRAATRAKSTPTSTFKSRPRSPFHKTSAKYGSAGASKAHSFNQHTGYNSRASYRPNQNQTAQSYVIPHRKLLFGHYLYYCGITNWHTIIKALVWQRTRRPKLGELGRQYGMLNNKEILHILRNRKLSESFGESAVKLGYLNNQQLKLIVFQQKTLQKKFGEFFIQNNILTPSQLNTLINQCRSHNFSVDRKNPSSRGRM